MKQIITFILTITMLKASMSIENPNDKFVMQKQHLEQYIGRTNFNEPLFENLPENTISSTLLKIKSHLPINYFLDVINFENNRDIKDAINKYYLTIEKYYNSNNINDDKKELAYLVTQINKFESAFFERDIPRYISLVSQIMAR